MSALLLHCGLVPRSKVGLSFVALAGVCLLGGCSVPADGRIGIARDVDGGFSVVVRTCTTGVDLARLSQATDNPATNPGAVFGEWRLSGGPDALRVRWPLLGESVDAEAVKPVQTLSELTTPLTIAAWTGEDTYHAEGPDTFTRADLEALEPGFVLAPSYVQEVADPALDEPGFTVVPVAEFDAVDCTSYSSH